MKRSDQGRDAELESCVPLVRGLLGLTETLDELQKRMLLMTAHYNSQASGRVHLYPPGSAAGGTEEMANL